MHPANINLNPLRNALVQKRRLIARMILSRLKNAEPAALIHLPQIGHDPVPRPPRRPIGLENNPVVMGLAVFISTDFSEEHTKMYKNASVLFKRVGLHYNGFWQKRRTDQAERADKSIKNPKKYLKLSNLG